MTIETLDTFGESHKTLIIPLIDSLHESPCIPAHGIAKSLTKNLSAFNHYKATIANTAQEIYLALSSLSNTDDLFVFTPIQPDIQSLIENKKYSLAQDNLHAWVCRIIGYCASQEIIQGKDSKQYNPYNKSYRFSVGEEEYFPLLLTPSSDRPGRNYKGVYNNHYYTCLTFQNYKTFDTFKIKNNDTYIDKLTMKTLRMKIREHLNNKKIKCPFHKNKLSEYPYEMEYIPLEASELNIPNKDYDLADIANDLGNILFARSTYLQLAGSPDFADIQANDIIKGSIQDLLQLIEKNSK